MSAWIRVPLQILAAILLFLVALICSLSLYLHAPWGGRTIATVLQEQISAGIAGELRIDRVTTFGLLRLRFEGVAFVDPEGRLAIAVDVVDLQLRALGLLEPRLEVDQLLLQGTRVEVATSEGGIGGVFGRREGAGPMPGPSEEPSQIPPSPPLPIVLRSIRIEGGSFRLVSRPGSPESIALIRGLKAAGEGAWEEGLAWIDLGIRGTMAHPIRRPLEVGAKGSLRDGWLRAEPVTLRLGESTLAVGGGADLENDVVVAALGGTLDPAEASYLQLPLAQTLWFSGSFGAAAGAQTAALWAGTAGGGELDLAASRRGQDIELRLDLQGIDPAKWKVGAPAAELNGAVAVDGRLRPLDLDLRVELDEGRLVGERVGPGRLEGSLEEVSGELEAVLERASLEIEGASLQGSGVYRADGSELQAKVQIGSLALLRPLLERIGGTSLEGLQGEGEVSASVRGKLEAPELLVDAKMETFALRSLRANELSVRASGRLGRGGLPVGSLRGSVGRLAWDRHHLVESRIDAARADSGDFHLLVERTAERRIWIRGGGSGPQKSKDGEASPGTEASRGGEASGGDRESSARSSAQSKEPAKGGIMMHVDSRGRLTPGELYLDRLHASLQGEGLDLGIEGSGRIREGRATGELAAAAGGIGLVRASFDLPLDLAAAPASTPIRLHLVAAPLDPIGLSPFVGVDLPTVRVRGALDLRGPIGAPDLQVEAQLSGLEVPGQPQIPPLDARIHGGIQGRELAVGLELWDGDLRIAEIGASGPMESGRLRRDPAGALSRLLGSERSRIVGTVAGLELGLLGAALDLPDLQGSAAADFDLRGPIRDPRGTIRAELRGGPAGPLPIVHAEASAVLLEEEVRLQATLHLPAPPQGEATSRLLPGQVAENGDRGRSGSPSRGSLERLDRLSEENRDKRDTSRGGRAGSSTGVDDSYRAEDQPGGGLGPPLVLDLRVGASLADLLGGRLAPSTAIELVVGLDSFDLASVTTGAGRRLVTRVDASAKGRRSRGRGRVVRIRDEQGRPGGERQGRQGPSEELEPEHLLQGLVSLGAAVRGTMAEPQGDAHLHARSLGWEGIALGDAELRMELRDGELDGRLHVIDAALGSFAALLHLGPGFSPLSIAGQGMKALLPLPMRLRMDADQLSIAPLGAVLGSTRTNGLLSLDLEADGPVAALQPVGSLRLDGATLELSGGLLYQGIELQLRLEEERLELTRLEGRAAGGGSFAMSGEVGAPGAKPFESLLAVISQGERGSPTPFHAGLQARRLPVGGPGGVAAEISLDGQLEGTVDPVRGLLSTLTLDSTLVELPVQSPRALQAVGRPEDIVIVSGPKAEGPSGGPTGERSRLFPLELQLRTSAPLRIESPDVELRVRVDLKVRRGRDGEAVAEGTARTTQGTATALGRTFDIERAVVRWLPDPVANPHLEVTARYDGRQAVAWADVGGTVRNPSISLRSDPPLPESQIVSLILSGRTQNPGLVPVENAPLASGGATAQPGAGAGGSVPATSVIGAALTQKLGQALGPRVPVSVLASESAAGQPLVEAGTFILGRLYLGYVRNFLPEPGENANEVRAEYELSRTVGIETRFGDAAAGGVDVVWQKSFETPQQQRARKAAAREQGEKEKQGEPGREDAPVGEEEQTPPGMERERDAQDRLDATDE